MENILTKRLTLKRALQILQLRYGSQVKKVEKKNGLYSVHEICGVIKVLNRNDILDIEKQLLGFN